MFYFQEKKKAQKKIWTKIWKKKKNCNRVKPNRLQRLQTANPRILKKKKKKTT